MLIMVGRKTQDGFNPLMLKTYVNAYTAAETWAGRTDGERKFSREDYDKWMAGTEKGYTGFDWGDYIWKTSPQYYVNTNFSGFR